MKNRSQISLWLLSRVFPKIVMFVALLVLWRAYEYYKPHTQEYISRVNNGRISALWKDGQDFIQLNAFDFFHLEKSSFLCLGEDRRFGAFERYDTTDLNKANIALWRLPDKDTGSDFFYVFSYSPFMNRTKDLYFIERSLMDDGTVSGCFSRPVVMSIRNMGHYYKIKFEIGE